MKNLGLTILFIMFALPLNAQRFGYVDTDYILENLPQYQQAQNTLKQQTKQWNKEIEDRQVALEEREANFLNEKVLLTDEQIKKEQGDIENERKEIRALQEQRYGQSGDLITMRKSLVKPVQDQVWVAVKQVAERRNYGFIFDKGSNLIMVYTDPKFDISREVLLQLNPDALKEPDRQRSSAGNTNNRTNTGATRGTTGAKSRSNTKGMPATRGNTKTNRGNINRGNTNIKKR